MSNELKNNNTQSGSQGGLYDKLGGNSPHIWIITIMSKVSKKLVAKKNFTCKCEFYRPESQQIRFFYVPTGTR